ncbi:uncharacterized protein G2W53_044318 [Senna tora]|uniref:Uncharacterized protein n=1 Tax=Senna tora TaxID=362788 RepID=A0A834W0X6_9FABA|nr:uncharacterized protein G2W53_044318 [Senna tora]
MGLVKDVNVDISYKRGLLKEERNRVNALWTTAMSFKSDNTVKARPNWPNSNSTSTTPSCGSGSHQSDRPHVRSYGHGTPISTLYSIPRTTHVPPINALSSIIYSPLLLLSWTML